MPKDCHVYAWYPLTLLTILNSVCPGSPKKEPEPAGWHAVCGHIGYVLPVPVPRIQVSHKNQLRVYLNTIYCIMSTWLYYIYYIWSPGPLLFPFWKTFLIFFKIFSSFCIFPDLYFIDQLFIVAGPLFFDNWRTYTIMYMGSGGWLPGYSLPRIQQIALC